MLISSLLLSCWGFSFTLGYGVSFFGGIQHSPVDGFSAASCNSGVLAREDERMFYSADVDIIDGRYQNQTDYILCSQRWRSSIQSAKTKLGDDCGSDHELLIGKFTLKLNKVGKTTRPFRYDLN